MWLDKMDEHIRPRLQFAVIIMLIFLIPIDNLNAVLQRQLGVNGSISQFYKLSVICLSILTMSKKSRLISIIAIVSAVGWGIVHGFSSDAPSFGWLVNDLGFAIKLFTPLIFMLFSLELPYNRLVIIERFFIISYIFLAANLLASLFGFGFSLYEEGVGALGFFIAGNEVSGMQLVLCSAVLAFAFRRSTWSFLSLSILSILLGAMKGTKTGIFGVFSICIFTPLVMGDLLRGRLSIKNALGFFVFGIGFLVVGVFASIQLVSKLGIFNRFLFYLNSRGILGALFSGREVRVSPFFDQFANDWNLINQILGKGIPDGIHAGYIEFDSVDILSSFGVLGLLSVCLIWFYFILHACKFLGFGSRFAFQVFMLVIMLIIISNMSGHIFYSGLAMPFLGILLGILPAEYKREHSTCVKMGVNE